MNKRFLFTVFLSFFMLAAVSTLYAGLKLPYIISSHMVLQRNAPVRIWGWANAGELIQVKFHNQNHSTKAAADGNWNIFLNNEKAGGPYTLTVTCEKEKIQIDDVLVGEVWVCSGQSNMEWSVADAMNAKEETAKASVSKIRQFDVPNKIGFTPQNNTEKSEWVVCSPSTAANFSAVAYYYAKKIFNELHVPIGLVNSTWGGTTCEVWTSNESLLRHPDFKDQVAGSAASAEKLVASGMEKQKQTEENFQGNVSFADEEKWKQEGYDDFNWKTLDINKPWEEQGLPDYDGVVWYRTSIVLDEEEVKENATLRLGAIDDIDETYINGVFVGKSTVWNQPREYAVQTGILKPGKNIIAVRVTDNTGGGGFYGNAEKQLLLQNGRKILLDKIWKARIGKNNVQVSLHPNMLLSSLYNGMINPIINYSVRGAIWYQGESNADNAEKAKQYETLFPLMINDWRSKWQQGDFPFYFVQLSSYDPAHKDINQQSNWAMLRNAQAKTLALKKTGMAVTIDIGERDDIHPKNKQDVGKRLALIALNKTYKRNLICSGPVFKSMQINSSSIILLFSNTGSGLVAKPSGSGVKGFIITGSDGKKYEAEGTIKNSTVTILLKQAIKPVSVKYAWLDDAGNANLYNKEGLPAEPFNTGK